jgi:hypothetical protein
MTMDFIPPQIMDSVSLPSLVGTVFAILLIHRVYLRYQEYQVIYLLNCSGMRC